jgi:hypothetical protein
MIRLNETSIIEQKRERLFLAIKGKNWNSSKVRNQTLPSFYGNC